jgi:hypothetical protein
MISSGAAGSAADKQSAAAMQANQLQREMFDQQQKNYEQQRSDQQPWRQAGQQALSQLGNPDFQRDFTMSDFQQDPGYQFRMQQGMDALQASAAARGGLMSGNTLKAITDYGQNFASNEYQNAYNRFNNDRTQRFNRLSSIAGVGQTANGQIANANAMMGQAGQNYAGQVGQNLMGAANAQGAAGIAGANAWGNTLSGLGKNWMDYSMMSRMNNGMGGTGEVSPMEQHQMNTLANNTVDEIYGG